jgi:pentatricopeptide repeat protein
MALAEYDFTHGKIDEATQELKNLAATAGSPERKLEAQAKLAEYYVAKANYTAAEPVIADMLSKDRRNTAGLRLRAAIRIEQGQFDQAIADLREALNDQPKSPELLLLIALAYERSGKNELAERQYADALKASGFNPSVGLRYVSYLQRRGDAARAEDVLTEMSSANPRNIQILSALAQTRLTRKNWSGALAVADTIASLGDDHGLADQVRASALAGQNKIPESIAALEKAHASAPDAVQPVVALISSYVRLGKPDKAEALMNDMLGKYPDNSELLVLMGQIKLSEKKSDEALQFFKSAIAKKPKDSNGYSALSDFYVRQKNYDAAAAVIQSGLKQQPDNANLRLTLASLQILKGDQGAAIAQYQAILKEQPNSMIALNNLVSLILDSDSDKEGLKRALTLAERLRGSNVPQFEDTYGWAQYKQGDYKGALSTLEAAQTKMPDLAAIRYHLGMSYAAVGQADKAGEQFKAALALEADGTPLKDMIRAAMK